MTLQKTRLRLTQAIYFGEPPSGGGGGSGTVTSIAAATGITLTPNPITGAGTVGLTIPVVVSSGGTGAITLTGILKGNGVGAITGGAVVDLTTDVTGILPYANGGTNASTAWTPGSIIFAGATTYAQNNSNLNWDNTNKRLGIGVAMPTAILDVQGVGGVFDFFNFSASSVGTGFVGGLINNGGGSTRIGIDDSTGSSYGAGNYATVFGPGGANPLTLVTSGVPRLTILPGGNVGIGTVVPADPLTVYAPGNTEAFRFQATVPTTGYIFGALANVGGTSYWAQESSPATGIASGSLAYATLFGADTNTATQIMANAAVWITVLPGGAVGVGTNTPAAKLAVNGGVHVGGDSDPGDNNLLVDGTLTLSPMTAGSVPFAGTAGLFSQDNANLFWDAANKRLGIGTATPADPLEVVGAIKSSSIQLTTGANLGYILTSSATGVGTWNSPASGMTYKGAWDATANTPVLADGTGTLGDTYAVAVGGVQFTRTFVAGGWAIYNGSIWESIGTSAAVTSVNGSTGAVSLVLASAQFVNQGTTVTVLHGNAAGNPAFGAVALTTDVSGVLPVANGGTGTASTLTGLVRGSASAMTAAEISGDGTTTGTNALTVTKLNGTSLAALGTGILKNTTGTGIPSIAVAADIPSLLTTKGDVLSFSTIPARLGIGANTYVLTADSTQTLGLHWAVPLGGNINITSVATALALNATHTFVRVDASGAARTITLPTAAAAGPGKIYYVKKTDSSANAVIIATSGGNTLDGVTGATAFSILTQYQSIGIISPDTGADWSIF